MKLDSLVTLAIVGAAGVIVYAATMKRRSSSSSRPMFGGDPTRVYWPRNDPVLGQAVADSLAEFGI